MDHDWAEAIQKSNTRNREFPLFERTACKVFENMTEDDESELMIHVSDIIDNYLFEAGKQDMNGFRRNRLMMFLIARLGKKKPHY